MGTKFSKFLSLLLCLIMVVGLLPTVASAEGTFKTPANLRVDGNTLRFDFEGTAGTVEEVNWKLYNTRDTRSQSLHRQQ